MSIVDLHVHTGPSVLPRRHTDTEIDAVLADAGVDRYVLKAHEGSTAERAALVGGGAVGGIVLNSAVGGANPDAVMVAAGLGARVVWMPTVSAAAHIKARRRARKSVHGGWEMREVQVCNDGHVLDAWTDVFDIIAEHDLVLASGHLASDEAVAVFTLARKRGVQRLLVTHPLLDYLGWRDTHAEAFASLGAYLEVGVLADLAAGDGESATARLARLYSSSQLVFGSDLGHRDFPEIKPGIESWIDQTSRLLGAAVVERITDKNGRELLAA